MPLTQENIRLFQKLFVSSYKKCSHEESKISHFPNLCPSYLNKVYITNSSCESQKCRYFEINHEVLINNMLTKIQNLSFIHQVLKVGLSRSKKTFICFNDSPSKMMKNAFFYLKSFFRSQDIQIFVLTFWKCRKNRLIRKISQFRNL